MDLSPFKVLFLIAIFEGTTSLHASFDDRQAKSQIFITPKSLLNIRNGKVQVIKWSTTLPDADHSGFEVLDQSVGDITFYEETFFSATFDKIETGKGSFNVSAISVGITFINFTIFDKYDNNLGSTVIKIRVNVEYTKPNPIFIYISTALIFAIYVIIGATLDLNSIQSIAKRPIGPLLGMICQFGLMPLTAFGLSKIFFGNDNLKQLGMFLLGTNPGGVSSNLWTLLLGGSLDLSVMMTLSNTVITLGALPMWTLTIGPKILDNGALYIPYGNVAYIIVSIVIPCCSGVLIRKCFPQIAEILEKKALKQMAVFNLCFSIAFEIYYYRYLLKMFTWKIILATFTLSALGYLFGLTVAFLAKRPNRDIIAICIEAGVQNSYIPIIILNHTIGQPMANLAVVIPACAMLMTHIPLIIALVSKMFFKLITQPPGGHNESTIIIPYNKHKTEPQIYTISLSEPVIIETN